MELQFTVSKEQLSKVLVELLWGANLRNALLCPIKVSLYLLRRFHALCEIGLHGRQSAACARLQFKQFAVLRVKLARSAQIVSERFLSSKAAVAAPTTYVCVCVTRLRSRGIGLYELLRRPLM